MRILYNRPNTQHYRIGWIVLEIELELGAYLSLENGGVSLKCHHDYKNLMFEIDQLFISYRQNCLKFFLIR